MKRPAVFFDRDNTLIVSDGYLGDPERVVLMDGAAEAIARARELGFAAVVVSNQSGVARGMFDEEAVHAVNARLDELLAAANPHAVIDRHEFCPYHPEGTVDRYRRDSDLRKPGCGMILQAAEALALDLSRSWLVGDAPRDIEAGKAAGCRTILFTPPDVAASPAAAEAGGVEADHAAASLREAIDFIAAHPATRDRGEDDGNSPAENAEAARVEAMSIPHHAHLPPRVESAARLDDPAAVPPPAPPTPTVYVAPSPPPSGQEPTRAAPPFAARTTPERDADRHLAVLAEQILDELRRSKEQPIQDFSVSKMLAGITQVMTLAVLFLAYLNRGDPVALNNTLLFALILQTMTIALLIMHRGK